MPASAAKMFLSIVVAAPLVSHCTSAPVYDASHMSLLQRAVAVSEGDASEASHKAAKYDCDNVDDMRDLIDGFANNSSDAVKAIVDQVNDTFGEIVEQVNEQLETATKALASAKSAVAMAAAFGKGGDAVKLVGEVLDELTPKLDEVKEKLQELIQKVLEKLDAAQNKFDESLEGSTAKYRAALEQVTALCSLDAAELVNILSEPKGFKSKLAGLFRSNGDDFAKADKAIADANKTAAQLNDMIDDLNATAFEQLDVVFGYVDTTLTDLKDALLPKALEKLDGKVPAPMLAIATNKANAAFTQLLGVVDDVKETVADSAGDISEQTVEAKAQLAPAFEATDGMTEIVQSARETAEASK